MLFRALLICWICLSQNLAAVEIGRLFEAEVIAKSESPQDKHAATKQALEIVLSRVLAGNSLQGSTVQMILAKPEQYVSEFQYALVSSNKTENNSARLIRVLFNETLLVDILRTSKLQFWNEIRNRTLVWLVVEEDGKKRFFDASLMPEVDAAMTAASRQKSLPVIYPLQDLQEKRIISISDVLSAYSEHLLEISSRYDVVSTLAGKLVKKDHCWKAEWTLYFDGKIKQWKSQCAVIKDVALNGFQGIYDNLSKYYAVKSSSQKLESTIIKIANIKKASTLELVSNYLESLPMVSTATWLKNEGKYNVYRLFYLGKPYQLSNAITKDQVLRAENFSEQSSDELTYQLISELH